MRIIDTHAHFGDWFFPIRHYGKQETLRLMEQLGIEKSIFSSAKAIVYDFREGNRDLKEVITDTPQMLGYVVINPNYVDESKQELDSYLELPDFVGVKCHASYTGCPPSSPAAKELLRYLQGRGKPILYHSNLEQLAEVAQEFPDIQFICPHFGAVSDRLKEMPKPDNLYVDFCATATTRDKVRAAVQWLGAKRVLFGTDLTLINPSTILGMIEDAEISPEDKELVMHKNAVRLFRLEPMPNPKMQGKCHSERSRRRRPERSEGTAE